ncbi:Cation transport ATPase [Geosmithia morbida]|uniref:Cation transport ATPase n=1 Tax=Geosmithia morbida TaxID=1094350 RepID=A0A9P4YZ97_9HYPO|nr:Cation transport ATPase [Geosmithia morbida]KAF4125655.1 Cation transport ATPase [Geosmithia morbida]
MASIPTAITSYLVENLHCPSCVSAIKTGLHDAFGDCISWVSPNLVTSVVTVEHKDSDLISVTSIKRTLEDLGFEVSAVDTSAHIANDLASSDRPPRGDDIHPQPTEQPGSDWPLLWLERRSTRELESGYATHLEVCQECRSAAASGEPSSHATSSRVSPDATPPHRAVDITAHPIPDALQSVVIGNDDGSAPQWRATISIGGMTCSSCSNGIREEMSKLPWVSNIAVNLVTNSATAELVDPQRVHDLAGAIEDLGYDATIDKVVNVKELVKTKSQDEWREVQIKINGMFCPRCPHRLSKSLSLLGPHRLQILEEPTLGTSLIKIKYRPDAPSFTIRHIMSAISATDPSLGPSIYHPPTMEDRARDVRTKHQKELIRRELVALALAVPTFVLGIVYMSLVSHSNPTRHYLTKPWKSGVSRLDLVLCLLATPAWVYSADMFHRRSIKELRAMWRPGSKMPVLARFYRFGSMDMLVSLGTTIAYISSVAQMIATAASGGKAMSEGLMYFDTVVFLVLFILAGRIIEAYSKSKAGNAVEMLVKLRPDTAILVDQDKSRGQLSTKVALDLIDHGDIIMVQHGASPPADGVIVTGQTDFDESSLTGESRPVPKVEGDSVFSGTINKGSMVTVRVTGTAGRSMLDQIVDVVREGQTKRAPMERIADVLTSYFVPVVTLLAIITWFVWLALGLSGAVGGHDDMKSTSDWVAFAFRFAIAVFVVACPCGLGLAAPTAIFVGSGLAAKYGILAKGGGEAFEKAFRLDCVVFDKTGTLTQGGEPRVTDSLAFPAGIPDGMDEATLWSSLSAVEIASSHPIARAIVDFCGVNQVSIETEKVEELPGKGMTSKCRRTGSIEEGFSLAVGNAHLLASLAVDVSRPIEAQLETWKREAKSVALVALQQSPSGPWMLGAALAISDPIRSEAPAAIRELQDRGIEAWMLSGDNLTTARAVARQVGIPPSNVLAEVLPSEKADKIKYLQATATRRGNTPHAMVAMVGDGINDSPALTAADVGIAIGSGSDVAISSADFVLSTSHLGTVPTLLDLSRTVFRRIRTNFSWAVIYNLVAIPFAAGCFYGVRTPSGSRVTLPPEFAALAMALSSISVVLSSLALRIKLPIIGFRPRQTVG